MASLSLHSESLDTGKGSRHLPPLCIVRYDFALRQLALQCGERAVCHYYMVGDNPHSDMQGCINMNAKAGNSTPWSGVLVRKCSWNEGPAAVGAEP
jgi:hypothetical protein